MGDDKIEQLEGEMSNSLRELRDFIAGELLTWHMRRSSLRSAELASEICTRR
jgi:hypothetical protein